MTAAADLTHRVVDGAGVRLHVVEAGDGPIVLLVHGFPESWYSWRHQLPVLAAAGFRAVAIDVRGYGESDAPPEVRAYGMLQHVADAVAVVAELGGGPAAVVGHDWGSPIAGNCALLRPDVFSAVGLLSVPWTPRSRQRPTDRFREMGGSEEFYISYFQEPGRAESEIEPDIRSWLLGYYASASGDNPPRRDGGGFTATVPPGGRLRDRFWTPALPLPWLDDGDLDIYVDAFARSGFTGPLNRYRNVDRDWEDLAFAPRAIRVPALYVGGERDGPTIWGAPAIARFPETLPDLRGSHVLPGCGHWTQQERPDEVNDLLVAFLRSLSWPS